MIVWYNKKRWAVADRELQLDGTPERGLCHLVSCDDTVAQYKTVLCSKVELVGPGPDYWDRRDNKLGLQTGRQ